MRIVALSPKMLMRGVLVLGILALAGCGQNRTMTVTNDDGSKTEVTAKADGSKTVIKGDGMTMTADAGTASATFPAFAPQYPGSKVVSTMKMDGGDKKAAMMVALETTASPAEVLAFYRSRFKAGGVPVNMETASAEGGMIVGGQDGKDGGAMITVGVTDGKTTIGIVTGTNTTN